MKMFLTTVILSLLGLFRDVIRIMFTVVIVLWSLQLCASNFPVVGHFLK